MGNRPDHVKPPAYLTQTQPVPAPRPIDPGPGGASRVDEKMGEDPTRFGDWTSKGIAVDF